MIDFAKARRRLALIWFAVVGVLFVTLVVQTLGNKFGGGADRVWNWFLPNVMPTLSLIVATLVRDAFRRVPRQMVRSDVFAIAIGLSAVYLVLLMVLVFAQPFLGRTLAEIGAGSGLYLGPLQGLVAGALGVFYSASEKAEP